MISPISASASYAMRAPSQIQNAALTSDQGNKLTDILSKYDAKNVTTTDAKAIAAQVKELGIEQGKALAEAMKTQGFDASAIGSMVAQDKSGGKADGKGGPEGSRPPPPPPPPGETGAKGGVDDTAVSLLAEVIASYDGTEMTEETWAEAMQTLAEKGVDLSKSMVDIRV